MVDVNTTILILIAFSTTFKAAFEIFKYGKKLHCRANRDGFEFDLERSGTIPKT